MILILIGISLGILISIYHAYNFGYMVDFIEYLMMSLLGAICGFFISLALATALPMDTFDRQITLDIVNLQDNHSIHGGFFIGSGKVEGKMKYVFYYEDNGFYKMMQVDYDKAKIKYSEGAPKVYIAEKTPTDALINMFAIDFNIYDRTYIIEVPEGTIKNSYVLDAQ